MKHKHNNACSENTTKMTKTILIRVVQRTAHRHPTCQPAVKTRTSEWDQ